MLKLLAVSALLCAMMALSSAEAAAEPEPEAAPAGELDVLKRWGCRPRPRPCYRPRPRPCYRPRPRPCYRPRPRPCYRPRPRPCYRPRPRPCYRPRPRPCYRPRPRPCYRPRPRPCHRPFPRPCPRPRPRPPCRSPWTKIGCRYFLYVSRPMTWHQAEQNCRCLGGHLASVHSAHQYRKIRELIRRGANGEPVTWIGGTDARCEGHWRWSDGTSFNYKGWCCGEPNNAGNQDCLQMNFSCRKCWDDAQCCLSRPSVCVRNRR